MAEAELRELVQQLQAGLHSRAYGSAPAQLARAKQLLLRLDALLPTPTTPPARLALARDTLELGALVSIRLRDPPAFTRYVGQLQPLYAMPAELFGGGSGSGGGGGGGSPVHGNKAKITGLYLLLLLSQGDYAGFHTLLEALAAAHEEDGSDGVGAGERGNGAVEQDPFIQYPVRLERALMEGSYDRVWGETKSERVPSEEFGVFSEVSRASAGAQRCARCCLYTCYGSSRLANPPLSACRFWSALSGRRLRPARSGRMRRCPSPTRRTSSSSTAKAPSSTLPATGAGLCATAASTSRPKLHPTSALTTATTTTAAVARRLALAFSTRASS